MVTAKTKDTLPVDDKIPLHTTKDNLPIFLLEPENTYVVKNKPATLKCRAANALEVSMFIGTCCPNNLSYLDTNETN